jgi:hypothetical protein
LPPGGSISALGELQISRRGGREMAPGGPTITAADARDSPASRNGAGAAGDRPVRKLDYRPSRRWPRVPLVPCIGAAGNGTKRPQTRCRFTQSGCPASRWLVPDSQLWLRRPCVHAALTHGMSDVIVIMIIEYHLFHIIVIMINSGWRHYVDQKRTTRFSFRGVES